jgi:hypothetical protein
MTKAEILMLKKEIGEMNQQLLDQYLRSVRQLLKEQTSELINTMTELAEENGKDEDDEDEDEDEDKLKPLPEKPPEGSPPPIQG